MKSDELSVVVGQPTTTDSVLLQEGNVGVGGAATTASINSSSILIDPLQSLSSSHQYGSTTDTAVANPLVVVIPSSDNNNDTSQIIRQPQIHPSSDSSNTSNESSFASWWNNFTSRYIGLNSTNDEQNNGRRNYDGKCNGTNLKNRTMYYHQAPDDHLPIPPIFIPRPGSHHHVHIPHYHHPTPPFDDHQGPSIGYDPQSKNRRKESTKAYPKSYKEKENEEKEEVTTTTTYAVKDDIEEDEEVEVTTLDDLIAGGIAGSASVVVGHPFDTIKVRMQTGGSGGGTNISSLMNAKAIKGLFRGITPPLGAAGLVNALVFSSYGWSNRLWEEYLEQQDASKTSDGFSVNNENVERASHVSSNEQNPVHSSNNVTNANMTVAEHVLAENTSSIATTTSTTHDNKAAAAKTNGFQINWKAYCCGCFAGLTQTFVLCPTEHVKCRLQVQANSPNVPDKYKGPLDCTKQIIRSHGLFNGLYRGWIVTAWREVPAFGLYFTSYDYLKDTITSKLKSAGEVSNNSNGSSGWDQPWIASGLSGGVSGCITWLAVYPFDIIKSRIQVAPLDCKRGIIDTAKMIVKEGGGIHSLFRGLGVTLLRAFPVNGVIFPVYEFVVLQLTGGDRMVD